MAIPPVACIMSDLRAVLMHTKASALVMSFLFAGAVFLRAGEPLVIPLWTNGAPGFEDRRNEPEEAKKARCKTFTTPPLPFFSRRRRRQTAPPFSFAPAAASAR